MADDARNPADGWYPNVFAHRIGLDQDPRHQKSDGPTSPSAGRVASMDDESDPKWVPPTLAEWRAVLGERDALREEIERIRRANLRLSEELTQAVLRAAGKRNG